MYQVTQQAGRLGFHPVSSSGRLNHRRNEEISSIVKSRVAGQQEIHNNNTDVYTQFVKRKVGESAQGAVVPKEENRRHSIV